jgi:hypothetical protein
MRPVQAVPSVIDRSRSGIPEEIVRRDRRERGTVTDTVVSVTGLNEGFPFKSTPYSPRVRSAVSYRHDRLAGETPMMRACFTQSICFAWYSSSSRYCSMIFSRSSAPC